MKKEAEQNHPSGGSSSATTLDPVLANELLAFVHDHALPKEVVRQAFSPSFYSWFVKAQDAIPLSVFDNDYLSSLEVVVKYLHENLDYRFVRIAKLVNRSAKTIWATYTNAVRKMPQRFEPRKSSFFLPISLFYDRAYSPLEVVVRYLKDDCRQTYHQIAVLLNRDDRTIWTTYHRMKNKQNRQREQNKQRGR